MNAAIVGFGIQKIKSVFGIASSCSFRRGPFLYNSYLYVKNTMDRVFYVIEYGINS